MLGRAVVLLLAAMSWWAVFTEPRRELFARDRLVEAGVPVYCPHVRVTRRQVIARHRGWRQRTWGERVRERYRITTGDEAVLPRYLFAHGDLATILAVRGVLDVVRNGVSRNALTVPDAVVAAARLQLGDSDGPARPRAVARLSEALRWKTGDQAFMRAGTAFAGLCVTLTSVARLDTTGEIEGWLSLFGRASPVKFSYEDVERVISASSINEPSLAAA